MAHRFTHEEAMFIIAHARENSRKGLTSMVNEQFELSLSEKQISSYIKNHHIYTGRTGYFPKGHMPFNKGTHIKNPGSEKTQFKPGHTPVNFRPVGSERTNVDGYVEVKVKDPKTWRMKHVIVWESENGPVPKGHTIIFGDGNRKNFSPDNLILVTRGELAVLNRKGLIQGDSDLTKTGILIAKVLMACRSRKNNGGKNR